MNYEFELPWPPSINGYWRSFKGRQIISAKGRGYRTDVDKILESYGLKGEMVSKKLTVHIVLNPPTLRRYDIDNFCKAIFDALSHSKFWVDDEQVYRLSIKKGVKTKGGNVQVRVLGFGE